MLKVCWLVALVILDRSNFLNGNESIKINGADSAEIEYEEGDEDGQLSNAVMIDSSDDDSFGNEEVDANGNYVGYAVEDEDSASNPLNSDDSEVPDIPEDRPSGGAEVEDIDLDGGEESGEVIDPYANSGYPDMSVKSVNFDDPIPDTSYKQYAPQVVQISQRTLPENTGTKSKRFEDRYPDLYESIMARERNRAASRIKPSNGAVADGDLFGQPLEQLYQNYKEEQIQKFKNRRQSIEIQSAPSDPIKQSKPIETSDDHAASDNSVPVSSPVSVPDPVKAAAVEAVAEPIDKQHMSSQIQFLKSADNSEMPRVDTKGVIIRPLPEGGSNRSSIAGSAVIESGKPNGKVLVPKRQRRILARYKVIIPVIVPNLRVKMPRRNATKAIASH